MRKHLSMIYGMQRLFAFKFHHDSAVYHEVGSKPTFQLYSAVNQGNAFCCSTRRPISRNSNARQVSYADSRRPGPSLRWILMAAPMIFSVSWFEFVGWLPWGHCSDLTGCITGRLGDWRDAASDRGHDKAGTVSVDNDATEGCRDRKVLKRRVRGEPPQRAQRRT